MCKDALILGGGNERSLGPSSSESIAKTPEEGDWTRSSWDELARAKEPDGRPANDPERRETMEVRREPGRRAVRVIDDGKMP